MPMLRFTPPDHPPTPGEKVRVRAPGKINLALEAGPKEPSGYHELATVFLAVDLYEDLTVTLTEEPGIEIAISPASQAYGASSSTPLGDDNLVAQAARALDSNGYLDTFGLHIEITKNVPIAGGMAGGSADAAATLVACDYLWRLNSSREDLDAVARELGADVPFCLLGGLALGVGRGDQLSPILSRGHTHWALIFSDKGLSTPKVFAALDRLRAERGEDPGRPEISRELLSALNHGDVEEIAAYLNNDLQAPAVKLDRNLGGVMNFAEAMGALRAIISGSGPTIACLMDGEEDAHEFVAELLEQNVNALQASGPVPGAAIIATN
ncbi:4-(cytidine 5'-diphospho)-2-C-methyl-D-erythritol kinase [Haematomicrobium sanguinis]|uniref:4-(cytidine 5'-diphospho)-2-C-methyl-D-erythritol kinase n=1 Tax=Haematomicrobium sanguinis TaxID=479106 RepID=UPI001F0A1C1A|nr:4-(cytidine 5'-diphospho)-2-C-methyl-D-erythritol kinase [Haematomicrobium sanguinis]